jgi:hypothetical protein
MVVVLVGWQPEPMRESVRAVVQNLWGGSGRWGVWWWGLAAGAGMWLLGRSAVSQAGVGGGVGARRMREVALWLGVLVGFGGLVLALAAAREPYRIGWGDSANRMLTSGVGIGAWAVVVGLVNLCTPGGSRRPGGARVAGGDAATVGWRRPSGAVGLLLGGALAMLAVGLWVAVSPVDPVRAARVEAVSGQDFLPSYPLELALRGGDGQYAAAVGPGEVVVTLGLDEPVRGGRLVVEEYAAVQRWTDFTWEASADGAAWRELGGAVPDGPVPVVGPDEPPAEVPRRLLGGLEERQGAAGHVVPLPADWPLTHLRLTFRHAADQDRLLLRRLRYEP